ncbi:FGGY-family carbohydrate kinase [bacterium]|nr:FGGY-family carbohydrate kinase [bacterium]
MSGVFIGVDVGTGSARAGIFDRNGRMLASATQAIAMNRPQPDFVEQSSDDIWKAVCHCVKSAVASASVKGSDVWGIGFDATCSLVVVDAEGEPVSVSPSAEDQWNIIVWMDHRAIEQAEFINSGDHEVLRYVGGTISPEMQSPKLLWLKQNMPKAWNRAAHFFDLPDFLVWRATDANIRSLCSTVCKWTYMGHEKPNGRWDAKYWRAIGLGELAEENWSRIGTDIRPMGSSVRKGLSARAAAELGLEEGTSVGVSIIDAHAGGIGIIGAELDDGPLSPANASTRLALIGGTSSCHMAVSVDPTFIDGVWGPYYSAMIPGYWLNEGGQSATGALIDHVIFSHSASNELKELSEKTGQSVYELLNAELDRLADEAKCPVSLLTHELHVLPYFHGNRSPRADPTLKGMVCGLRLGAPMSDLALLYLAAIQAVAFGTRHIIEAMNADGYRIKTICACGGGTKNPVYLQQHADITGCRIILSKEPEAVLLGSAILGAVASGEFGTIEQAMAEMSKPGRIIDPANSDIEEFHKRKYQIFKRMYHDQITYRELMGDAGKV